MNPSGEQPSGHVPLAVATRGGRIEGVHYGSVAVTDAQGMLLFQAGDPAGLTFARSAMKPFQAMPLFAHPGFDALELSGAEQAVLCASHSGEPRHAEAVLSLLHKAGVGKGDLQCGTHVPLYYEALGRWPKDGDIFTPLQHNCSGKHAGMLAQARLLGAPLESYLEPGHAVQRRILAAVSHFTGVPQDSVVVAVDGCSAPTFAVPLASLARAFAGLALPQDDAEYGLAPRRIFEAMTGHPEMVSGLKRIDLALMHTGGGDWVSKIGAEAVHGIGIRSRGWGVAIKVADGASRALHVVTVEVLRQLALLEAPRESPLAVYLEPPFLNCRGIETGVMRPVFQLQAAGCQR